MKKMIIFLMFVVLCVYQTCAFAHEKRMVEDSYQFVVGFLKEPAFFGEMNALDLRISSKGNVFSGMKPVVGAEKTLQVKVIDPKTGEAMDLTLSARYHDPGAYAAYFYPNRPGQYIFEITGELDGRKISEKFESGPGRFSDVREIESLKFPKKTE